MLVAHHLARGVLPEHTSKFSRKDFTLPQLFACLVVKEQQKRIGRSEFGRSDFSFEMAIVYLTDSLRGTVRM